MNRESERDTDNSAKAMTTRTTRLRSSSNSRRWRGVQSCAFFVVVWSTLRSFEFTLNGQQLGLKIVGIQNVKRDFNSSTAQGTVIHLLEELSRMVDVPSSNYCNNLTLDSNNTSIVKSPSHRIIVQHFVNCKNDVTGALAATPFAPMALQQCEELKGVPGVTVVSRNDLFATDDSDEDADTALLGSVTFHYKNTTAAGKQNEDVEWILSMLINHGDARVQGMAVFMAESLNCTRAGAAHPHKPSYRCAERSIVNANTLSSITVQPFFPGMYQMRATAAAAAAHHTNISSFKSDNSTSAIMDAIIPSVAVIRDAYAEVATGRIQTSSFSCTQEQQYLLQFNQCGGPTSQPFRIPTNFPKFDRVVLISAKWSDAYYHATVEQLPRLVLLRDFLLAYPGIPVLIAAKRQTHSTLHLYADILGVNSTRVVAFSNSEIVHANTIYVPEPTPCGHLQPLLAKATQTAIRQTVIVQDAEKDSIVVIRRRGSRSIVNHDDMMQGLRTALPDERWVVFDDGDQLLPAPGIPQWTVFSGAKVVIAPHGAGLSNLLACRPGTAVVEFLASHEDFNICYLSLASVLNLDYHPLKMEPVTRTTYSVDVPHIVRVVTSIARRRNDLMKLQL